MTEDDNNSKSRTETTGLNSEAELKPEERMPDITIAAETNNEWVRDIDYEKILKRIDVFQKKTGLSDEQLQAILDGGNYQETSETPLDDDYFKDMKEEYGLDRDELIDEALRISLLSITNDRTIERFEILKQEAGFSSEQLVKILTGSSEHAHTVLEEMTNELHLRDLQEMQSKGGATTDEIATELEGIGKNLSRNGAHVIGMDIMNLHGKILSSEQEEDEEQSVEPKKRMSFRDRLKAEKPRTRTLGD